MAPDATVDELAAAWAGGCLVVDVREPDEYAAGHVPGARLTPLRSVPGRCDELPFGRPVFVVCASGNRSRAAADWMSSRGVDARSVTGGTPAWARDGRPVVVGTAEHAA
ncbi:rhodanese-like domain-containing protein [Streptomyces sp. NPDC001027]|uniref:rhodanese-like domain-containing protein n=1 Tax=Streptomyces sp. NPDC001027 TaxID=3154771 RepID=UPI00332C7224